MPCIHLTRLSGNCGVPMPDTLEAKRLPDIIDDLRAIMAWLDLNRHDRASISVNEAIETLNLELPSD